jgi:hypothetical protein
MPKFNMFDDLAELRQPEDRRLKVGKHCGSFALFELLVDFHLPILARSIGQSSQP